MILRLASITLLVLLSGCATVYTPEPLSIPAELHDVQTKRAGEVEVSAGILTDEQAKAHFGMDLAAHGIQAIWLKVTNGSDRRLWFLRNALDADYFSADEVASVMHREIPSDDFEVARQRLRDESIRVALDPKTISEGFVFAPEAVGGRYVDVRLGEDIYTVEIERMKARERGEEAPEAKVAELRFGFAIPLPDGIFDYEKLDAEAIYPDVLPDLTLDELRAELEKIPCCATNADADGWGDPLNVVVIANTNDALNSLTRAGWSFTHRITAKSVMRLVGATLNGQAYPVAPVSNLYLFDRKQDFALQRARPNIAQRNHMRFWLAPFTYQNTNVWVGQVSRDIGIKVTPKSPTLTTHVIDPEVDMTREYLLHSLMAEGLVSNFGFVNGSQKATLEDPATNLTGDPYFSDGKRLIIQISPEPIPYARIGNFIWELSTAPVAEGQTEAGAAHTKKLSEE